MDGAGQRVAQTNLQVGAYQLEIMASSCKGQFVLQIPKR